jgi:hypothetical protein
MAKKLVLLTCTPRELDEAEYAKVIREIDYPAFRGEGPARLAPGELS